MQSGPYLWACVYLVRSVLCKISPDKAINLARVATAATVALLLEG